MIRERAVVMGAGFGGLAAAVRLHAMGYDVLVLEAGDQAGGRARVFEKDGFRFDAGPTVITAPYLFEELFRLVDRDPADYYELLPLDPFYRAAFPDGTHFDYSGDMERMLAQIETFDRRDADGYRRLLEKARRIFEIGYLKLSDVPFNDLSDMIRIVPQMIRLASYRSVYGMVSQYIRDERLRQAFSFQPLFIGGNPYRVPSIYLLIHALEHEWGIHFVRGGTGRIVSALVDLLEEIGVEVRFGAAVERIEVREGRVAAVCLSGGERLPCAALVSNADPTVVYRDLIEPSHRRKHTDRAVESRRYGMSLFVVYFGTDRLYDGLAHHTVIFGPRYRGLLGDIFDRKVLADDFSLYLHAPRQTDPGVAPPGRDLFYVLSPVPNQSSGIDWEQRGPEYADRILAALEESFLPDLRGHLVVRTHVDPRYFAGPLRSHLGAAFGPEPLLRQSAYFRYHSVSEDVRGLYFVGAGVHPGAGVPGVLCSAKVLEKVMPPPAAAASRRVFVGSTPPPAFREPVPCG